MSDEKTPREAEMEETVYLQGRELDRIKETAKAFSRSGNPGVRAAGEQLLALLVSSHALFGVSMLAGAAVGAFLWWLL